MKKYWRYGILLVIILPFIFMRIWNLNFGGSSFLNNAIDLNTNDQNYIMTQLNNLNQNNISEMGVYATGVTTASEIFFGNQDIGEDNLDLINFLLAEGGGLGVDNSMPLYGLPLTYVMVSSKILSSSTPYQLYAVVGVNLDEQSFNRVAQLFKNQRLIEKYKPVFLFGFVSDSNFSFFLDNEILKNQRPLLLDVACHRQNENYNWNSCSIFIDPSNNLKPADNSDDTGDDTSEDNNQFYKVNS